MTNSFQWLLQITTNINRHYFGVKWNPTPEESVTTSLNISLKKYILVMCFWKQVSLSYLVAHKPVNLLELFTLMWYHHWHKVHPKFPCEYILPWSNTVRDYLDHPLFKLIRKTNTLSDQHVLLNILQRTWKGLVQQIIKSYSFSNIWNKIHQTFKKIHKTLKIIHQIKESIALNN